MRRKNHSQLLFAYRKSKNPLQICKKEKKKNTNFISTQLHSLYPQTPDVQNLLRASFIIAI